MVYIKLNIYLWYKKYAQHYIFKFANENKCTRKNITAFGNFEYLIKFDKLWHGNEFVRRKQNGERFVKKVWTEGFCPIQIPPVSK